MKRIFPLVMVLALQAGSAFAHAGLEGAVPADGATVTAPDALVLTFTEAVSASMSGVVVKAADGSKVAIGDATLSDDKATLTIPLTAKPAAGVYTVEWHALSDDGHKTHGKFTFTVQ